MMSLCSSHLMQEDLESALEAIKAGTPVQKAASEFGIPSGTLYGRCKKVGIELSKNAAVHWSEEAMKKALASYQTGGMSINQAAIHYNLPYSSLYGRINRWKRESGDEPATIIDHRLVLTHTQRNAPPPWEISRMQFIHGRPHTYGMAGPFVFLSFCHTDLFGKMLYRQLNANHIWSTPSGYYNCRTLPNQP